MKKKNKIIYGSILSLALLLGTGISQVDAFWGGGRMGLSLEERVSVQETMFKEKAQILGLTLDEVKNAWSNGQNILDLAKSKGITEEALRAKMQTAHQEKMKEELKALVDKNVITQAQADARLKHMGEMAGKMGDKVGRGNKAGIGGWGRGF